MDRPYMPKDQPPATYTDGQPYAFRITVSDPAYHLISLPAATAFPCPSYATPRRWRASESSQRS
jgi:hypothetical protein